MNKDKWKVYGLRTVTDCGIDRYFVSFKDGQAVHQDVEVPEHIFDAFCEFEKQDKKDQNFIERHIEHSEQTDEALYKRALRPPESVEDIAAAHERDERLYQVIAALPEAQRKRFLLYHEIGLTYRQIADMEGCTARAVGYSVSLVEEKIRKIFEK
ncbi:MAG: sigma-70 family RNA polymerase sigma factor [Oscillospiraceae bacterium]|nr:sigma-70 family RNA polymerase sigma factor [Oscillospiraceae bacterium]